ncbi:unknown [Ruminococcus sp. CAG:624]|nr:unknown [Ruminococcus sp. CAG:624]
MIAIPEVKPVITGAGMYETSLPILRTAAITRILPL